MRKREWRKYLLNAGTCQNLGGKKSSSVIPLVYDSHKLFLKFSRPFTTALMYAPLFAIMIKNRGMLTESLTRKYTVNCKQRLLQSDDATVSYFLAMSFNYALLLTTLWLWNISSEIKMNLQIHIIPDYFICSDIRLKNLLHAFRIRSVILRE